MRCCHVITSLMTGGAETTLARLVPVVADEPGQCSVVSLTAGGVPGDRLRAQGVPVFELHMKPPFPSLTGLARLRSLLGELNPDLIQGWMYHGNLAASVAKTTAGLATPIIWNIRHSLYDLSAEKPTTRAVIRLSALLSKSAASIVYNSEVGASHHEAIGFAPVRSVVIRNGFDGDRFKPDEAVAWQLRSRLGLGAETVLVGMIARYHPMKGHENLLQAAARIRRTADHVHFVVAGRGVSWSNSELADAVNDRSLADGVHLLGELHDPAPVMAGLDVLCCPSSRGEGLANVVGEAMACGVPCVVTDIGDTPWLLGDAGRVVPPSDPAELAGALMELVSAGSDERRRLGEMARERVLDRLPLSAAAGQYRELYDEVLRN